MSLKFDAHFTRDLNNDAMTLADGVKGMFTWNRRDAVLKSSSGRETFRQNDVEVPAAWSDRALRIVAEKYLRVVDGKKETSVFQMAHRVANFISQRGLEQGVLHPETVGHFYDELMFLILDQRVAFNSPVWFNVGTNPDEKPQSSACFINGVDDDMDSITGLQKKEVMLFKGGSGTGTNLSSLRSSYEGLSNGGQASGPVSFMRGYDAWAGVTKSGGGTRRAAKMVVLNADHPDILECKDGTPGFIRSKKFAEQLAHDLYSTGKYTAEFNVPGNVYDLVPYQNANNSVRCTDDFMNAVVTGAVWFTRRITSKDVVHSYKAADVWGEIADATWWCGDPGVQFDTTTNKWHTCPNTGPINASNPCSEYLFLDDTACNLASWNLMRFWDSVTRMFDIQGFIAANRVVITAMEILVDASSYPSEEIEQNSHDFRPLGIGYANLGALLMNAGLAYDSDAGRLMTSAITALMSGTCYEQSGKIAEVLGAFPGFVLNKEPMTNVIKMHLAAVGELRKEDATVHNVGDLIHEAHLRWIAALTQGKQYGWRNAQISVIAPTGTISFMMDCETTGCEPMLDIVVWKKLVGEALEAMPNNAVRPALRALGYSTEEIDVILADFVNQLAKLSPNHRKVFQTAIGADQVSVEGHLKMMSAIQPFISGGISKTVNMKNTVTREEIADTYMMAWKLGLKCVALFRDNCKLSQPANTKHSEKKATTKAEPFVDDAGRNIADVPFSELKAQGIDIKISFQDVSTPARGTRKRLPDTREGLTHKATIDGQDFYFHVGCYEDGSVGEVFIDAAKAGSTLHGLLDAYAMSMSIGLQHGVPIDIFIEKMRDLKFEPGGMTRNKDIQFASSILDYLAKWLDKSLKKVTQSVSTNTDPVPPPVGSPEPLKAPSRDQSGPPCKACGHMTRRAGACWMCNNCGTTTGCG